MKPPIGFKLYFATIFLISKLNPSFAGHKKNNINN